MNTETEVLLSHLDGQRAHVRGILEGLDDEALRRPVLPSGWSCLGLVRHLTLDDERFWFRGVVAGEPSVLTELSAEGQDTWRVGPDVSVESVLAGYQAECARSSAVLRATDLAAAPVWWPEDQFGSWRMETVREVVLHVTVETACHAGHLDAARELIDGRQWIVLPE